MYWLKRHWSPGQNTEAPRKKGGCNQNQTQGNYNQNWEKNQDHVSVLKAKGSQHTRKEGYSSIGFNDEQSCSEIRTKEYLFSYGTAVSYLVEQLSILLLGLFILIFNFCGFLHFAFFQLSKWVWQLNILKIGRREWPSAWKLHLTISLAILGRWGTYFWHRNLDLSCIIHPKYAFVYFFVFEDHFSDSELWVSDKIV